MLTACLIMKSQLSKVSDSNMSPLRSACVSGLSVSTGASHDTCMIVTVNTTDASHASHLGCPSAYGSRGTCAVRSCVRNLEHPTCFAQVPRITGPCGRGHLALALLTVIKRDRYASPPVVDCQVNGVSLTSQASKFDNSGLKVSILP